MLDTTDPEIIESLKYLLVSREEKMKMQSQPFDGKKNCWIPDHKEGFLAAEIQSTKGEEVTVKTTKGEVITDQYLSISKQNFFYCFFVKLKDCSCKKRRHSTNESAKIREM